MSEAARIFETRLASALVAEDGQLALSSLAASAAGGFMPRIQTQGQLGQARWGCTLPPFLEASVSRIPVSLLVVPLQHWTARFFAETIFSVG